jgi:hypothetical protein
MIPSFCDAVLNTLELLDVLYYFVLKLFLEESELA